MLKRITLIAEVDGEVTKENLRLTVDDEGSIVLYPKDKSINFITCSVDAVEKILILSDSLMDAIDRVSDIYELPFVVHENGSVYDTEQDKFYPVETAIEYICEAIACDKGDLLNHLCSEEDTIETFKGLCERCGIPTNWEE